MTVNAAEKFRGFNFQFLADEEGEYEVTLKVTDAAGNFDTAVTTITVYSSGRTSYYVDPASMTVPNGTVTNPWLTIEDALSVLNGTNLVPDPATSVTAINAVFEDYYGNARTGGTAWAGCVASDPSP